MSWRALMSSPSAVIDNFCVTHPRAVPLDTSWWMNISGSCSLVTFQILWKWVWVKETEKDPKESILGGGIRLAEALECVSETLKGKGSRVGTEDKAISLRIDSSPSLSPTGSNGRESTCNVEDRGSIPRFRRSPGEGNSNP